jgi:hypothetical protein
VALSTSLPESFTAFASSGHLHPQTTTNPDKAPWSVRQRAGVIFSWSGPV